MVISQDIQHDIARLCNIHHSPYAVVGTGGYAVKVIRAITERNLRLPASVYHTAGDTRDFCGYQTKPLSCLCEENIILGSDVYQYQIIQKVLNRCCHSDIRFWDVSPDINGGYHRFSDAIESDTVIVFSTSPQHHERWLTGINRWFNNNGYVTVFRHPMQAVSDAELKRTAAVILWNGTVSAFTILKKRLKKLAVVFDFAECGFFPQKDYYYFDRCGINVASQLRHDELEWLPKNYPEIVAQFRERYFSVVSEPSQQDYIFVPLQLESDSNVQSNSRFTRGMQEFIDYIEVLYPNDKIRFKAHPLDNHKAKYVLSRGTWVEDDSLTLIKGARLVHGINSTVLFEAALYGVPVKAEGECLLNFFPERLTALMAAIILRQFPVSCSELDKDMLARFSHLSKLQHRFPYGIN
jgi:hypothetical protein